MELDEEQNIDDLVDYKDFESNLDSIDEEDSFNDDIVKIYEDHKKNFLANNKSTEIQNSQRPISKYKRNSISAKRNSDDENVIEIYSDPDVKEIINDKEIEKFILRLNKFLIKNKITRKQFIENPKIFLTIEEFKELFRKIHFEISQKELNYLFQSKNSSLQEGYISVDRFYKTFLDEIKFYEKEIETKIKSEFDGIRNNSEKNTREENLQTPNKHSEQILISNVQFINELKQLNDEVFKIVKEKESAIAKVNKTEKKFYLQNRIKSSLPKTNLNREKENLSILPPQSAKTQRLYAKSKNRVTSANIQNIIEEKKRKRKAEDEIIKLALERRNKETERDCIKKMSEANQLAEELDIMKTYTAHLDETVGLICRVFDKMTKEVHELNIKNFLFEYKKLKKMLKHKAESKNLKFIQNPNNKIFSQTNGEDNLINLNRESRQKIIKDILLNSLELKIQLKTQLKIIRNKKIN